MVISAALLSTVVPGESQVLSYRSCHQSWTLRNQGAFLFFVSLSEELPSVFHLTLHPPPALSSVLKCMGDGNFYTAMKPSVSRPHHHPRPPFDVTGTMDRLRSSLAGGTMRLLSTRPPRQQADDSLRGEGGHGVDPPNENSTLLIRRDVPDAEASLSPGQGMTRNLRGTDCRRATVRALSQLPAIMLIFLFHLMIGVAFGVSYFPIGWRNGEQESLSNADTADDIRGPFPLPGKEALGIRMFLFATIVGQVVFVITSRFDNPIGLQMVENVPFCHALSRIVIRHQGYGIQALSTLFVMFGLASLVVGTVFYLLGRFKLGRIVYYFPTHVLVGCIGGIGIFLIKTGVEVTIDDNFVQLVHYSHLLTVSVAFEVVLRILQRCTLNADGKSSKYPLLAPIYFCLITPIFYAILWILRIPVPKAHSDGYFFPPLDDTNIRTGTNDFIDEMPDSRSMGLGGNELLFLWTIIDYRTISWSAIGESLSTLLALTVFSLIHVPINIPAFALSTNVDVDMNIELMAHGYSNLISGLCGGLQNYMAYTQSVLYDRSGGHGKVSGMLVAVVTSVLFFIGPKIASYAPRCMAGTLLIHVGMDLFLEGVYDSFGKFDALEYGGIWLIAIVMSVYGMDAAMIAGVVAAVSTHAAQSIAYLNPIRGAMSATTLRSSNFTRNAQAEDVLGHAHTGRGRIFVIQLQGHVFFGNIAQLTENIHKKLNERLGTPDEAWIVILDFGLVLGIDSSAAQAIAKLRRKLSHQFGVDTLLFVTGSEMGFPCEFDLSRELQAGIDGYNGSHVFDSLDAALIFAEDALIYRHDPSILERQPQAADVVPAINDERIVALQFLKNLCPAETPQTSLELFLGQLTREEYCNGQIIWSQGAQSDCAKLVLQGALVAVLENEAGTSESISTGNFIGELGLVYHTPRMSTVQCCTATAILYSLSRDSYEQWIENDPRLARLVDMICIKYLANRVQHVSNRIFETRCLPI